MQRCVAGRAAARIGTRSRAEWRRGTWSVGGLGVV